MFIALTEVYIVPKLLNAFQFALYFYFIIFTRGSFCPRERLRVGGNQLMQLKEALDRCVNFTGQHVPFTAQT